MRRRLPVVAGTLLAIVGTFSLSAPARAECPYFVIPPATDAARSAREVIVGTVIENVGDQLFDFRLRIDHVLRGPARVGDIRRFEFMYPGWPMYEAGDGTIIVPCEAIPGSKGNVIAFSLGALGTDGKTRYNAASWISGTLPISRELPRTTLAQISTLAGLPETDAVLPAPDERPGAPPLAILLVLLVAVFAGIWSWRRQGRMSRETPR